MSGKRTDIGFDPLPIRRDDSTEACEQRVTEFRVAMKMFMETIDEQIEFMVAKARINFAFYKALCNAGFNEEQSLDIVKEKGV